MVHVGVANQAAALASNTPIKALAKFWRMVCLLAQPASPDIQFRRNGVREETTSTRPIGRKDLVSGLQRGSRRHHERRKDGGTWQPENALQLNSTLICFKADRRDGRAALPVDNALQVNSTLDLFKPDGRDGRAGLPTAAPAALIGMARCTWTRCTWTSA